MMTIKPLPINVRELPLAANVAAAFDPETESALQQMVDLAALICDAPIAVISIVNHQLPLLTVQCGLALTASDALWCRHTIQNNAPLMIHDAALDARFIDHPYVTAAPHIRFYAGIALIDELGAALGVLYVMDQMPRHLQPKQLESLKVIAKNVTTQLCIRQKHLQAVKTLNQELEQHRLVFESTATGLAKVSLDGKFLEVNDYIRQFLGYSEAELKNLKYFDITYLDDIEPSERLVKKLLCGELNSYSLEKRYIHKNGQLVWANLTVSIQHSANGVPLFLVAVIKAINERKQFTVTIAEAAQQYEHILNTSADGFWLLNADGYILDVNDAFIRVSGFSREELVRMHVNELNANIPATDGIRQIQQVISKGSDLFKTQYYRKDRSIVLLEVSATYLPSNHTLICFLRDISDREQHQIAMIQARIAADLATKRATLAERQIVNIFEETSKRIGLELHDDLGQHLTGIGFALETLFKDIEETGYALPALSRQITLMMDQAVSKTRNLASGLYPIEISDTGLADIFDQLAHQISMTSEMDCASSIAENNISDSFTIINLYRIVQEAANNIQRHSKATAMQIRLHDALENNAWALEISDNGQGVSKLESTRRGGLGMHTMHYRAMLIGATMEFVSNELGSSVRIFIPKQIATIDEN
jgi:PAS domain S-box-containing protein